MGALFFIVKVLSQRHQGKKRYKKFKFMSKAEESIAVNIVNAVIVVHNILRPGKRFNFWSILTPFISHPALAEGDFKRFNITARTCLMGANLIDAGGL